MQAILTVVLAVSLLFNGAWSQPTASRARAAGTGSVDDFNGDGFSDLAVGVPFEDVGATIDAGGSNVLYGTAQGIGAEGNQLWSQVSPGIVGDVESTDDFGWSVARGDFDGDGYVDLAIGVPSDTAGTVLDAGGVNVLYGSPDGLSAGRNQLWNQESPGILDDAEQYEFFGETVASGDFDADGFADLAIGVIFEDVTGQVDAGAVHVLYGSSQGLASDRNQLWSQDSPDVEDVAEDFDRFGWALATGDFDGNGFADLAIGVEREGVGLQDSAGAVNVLYGSSVGLTAIGNQFWTQGAIGGESEADDLFGESLAAGDFNGDGYGDLAAGATNEFIPMHAWIGAVDILYGSSAGLSATGHQFWTQESPGVLGRGQDGDRFGTALTAGHFDLDGFQDLAIGVDGDQVDGLEGAGAVQVLYGSSAGLAAERNQLWSQNAPGIRDVAETSDGFGRTLSVGDFNGDGYADLAVGVPNEGVRSLLGVGVVSILYGSTAGLSASGNQLWSQASPGILDHPESSDEFGYELGSS